MDSKERVELIRRGNEHFNKGEVEKAIALFVKTGYKDGLVRVADFFYYDRRMPLIAYKYYRMAGKQEKIDEIFGRMIMALSKWVKEDSGSQSEVTPDSGVHVELPPLKVSPKLKIFAEEILRKQEEEKQNG